MATLSPFRGLVYDPRHVPDLKLVVAPPYDVISAEKDEEYRRRHPHNVARGSFVSVNGFEQPRPAPRFSRTDSAIARPPARIGEHTDEALADWGFSAGEIAKLREEKAIA